MLEQLFQREIEEERWEMVRGVFQEVLDVLWDGDSERQADCPICQKINIILETD